MRDLKAILAADPRQLARNLLQQFTVYSTGTPVRYSDRREIEAMLDACAADGYRVRDLLLALVQSRIFLGNSRMQPIAQLHERPLHRSSPSPAAAFCAARASRWRCRCWNA